jgi:branched-chain amino acid transport system substrate-binding protein
MLEDKKRTDEIPEATPDKIVSRRDFLKIAGATGAAIGLAGGLGGLVAACGGKEETTTTAATTPTTAPPGTTTTSLAPSTSVTSAAGRDIKVGLISPLTGALAGFAMPAKFLEQKWNEALAGGVQCGDGKTHNIVIKHVDTQSDPQRAGNVAGDLISNDKVDVILVSSSPDTVVPVAAVCETAGTPMIASFVPWQPFFFGRQKTPDPTAAFKWTYAHALGLEEIVASFIDMWNQISTNKTAGFFFANDADGVAWVDKNTGLPPAMTAAGYKIVDPGLYTVPTDDFTTLIATYKKNACEIVTGTVIAPDFTNFWKQAYQQNYKPRIVTVGKALLFPETVAAIGQIADGVTVEYTWGPHWPFKSSLTGETCQQLADDYTKRTGNQWTAPIGTYDRMEWLVDALKRTDNVDDKEKLIAAIASTKLDTMLGPIDFTAPIKMGTLRPVQNVYMPPIGGGQWVKGTTYPFEIVQVSNVWSQQTQLQAKIKEMAYPA